MSTKIFTPLSSFASIDATLGYLNDLILDAVNNFIPRVFSSGKVHLPWLTLECSAVSQADLLSLVPVPWLYLAYLRLYALLFLEPICLAVCCVESGPKDLSMICGTPTSYLRRGWCLI